MTHQKHIPVLLDEVMQVAKPGPGQLVVDLTFGAGGYTDAFLRAGARVVAFDRDPSAIRAGRERFASVGEQLTLIEAPFDELEAQLAARDLGAVDAVVGDYGVSSMQLDEAARGFSFMADGPLDMRMGGGQSAADLLDDVDEGDLANILYQYGEERHSRRLAKRILETHRETPLKTTGARAAVVDRSLRAGARTIHPATRTGPAGRWVVA
ncbi:MAG: 16S rRNA (cytosine(1402)-N(4))-methyltransferase RsmH, partial [Pseudomonadota bacterium]